MPYVYGPLVSRRLGRSLGVDVFPSKTCNLNCVYCQLGPTPVGGGLGAAFPPVSTVLAEISKALDSAGRLDHVTLSGSGEPTLHEEIGPLIGDIKAMTKIPVAVITNGTRLASPAVRKALCLADVVLPSLDAAERRVFNRITRPPGGLDVEEVIGGLLAFRREFPGRFWLEIMLVKGVNDTPEQLSRLRAAVDRIQPDLVHLNTVVRPPAADWARPVSPGKMGEIAAYLGPRCEVIAEYPGGLAPVGPRTGTDPTRRRAEGGQSPGCLSPLTGQTTPDPLAELVLETVKRRPMTMYELAEALGALPAEVAPCVARQMMAGVIRSKLHRSRLYYIHKSGDGE